MSKPKTNRKSTSQATRQARCGRGDQACAAAADSYRSGSAAPARKGLILFVKDLLAAWKDCSKNYASKSSNVWIQCSLVCV
ncbi:hypothetical protein BDA96_04G049900 [Sorghum bicolor]|uniref:Uncharacterized protein n=1 Tax=Sorghum bicolor TaxID=4558 RepID=A0A921UHE8_SORBI|nr:hypothetical protein BDA96_04G049900 [Sorghum bicolor]